MKSNSSDGADGIAYRYNWFMVSVAWAPLLILLLFAAIASLKSIARGQAPDANFLIFLVVGLLGIGGLRLHACLKPGPALRIDENGIRIGAVGKTLIPWSEVTGIYTTKAFSRAVSVELSVRNEELFLPPTRSVSGLFTRIPALFGFPTIGFLPGFLDADCDEILASIERHRGQTSEDGVSSRR